MSGGYSFIVACGFRVVVVSLVAERGLEVHGLQKLWLVSFVASWRVGSS